ncbi:MAG: response regulator [Methylobacter sp.]|nr:MAG: response regulator [Methylobacter sp.]
MKDFMQGISDIPNQDVMHMKIFDGPNATPSALLYDNLDGHLSYSYALSSETLIWQSYIGGRTWTLQFTPTAKYLNIDYSKTGLVAVCGSTISLLLFFLIRSYQNTRRDALSIAEKLTAELRQSEARYHILVEQSSDAIFLCDLETLALEEVNLHFCQMLGYTYKQSRQLLLTDIVSTPEPEIHSNFQGLIDGGYRGLKEQVFHTSDGSLLDVEVSQSVVQVGLKKKIITTVRDISPRKRAEAERAQMERQLRQSQKMEALGQLTGGIAHDFNNILAAMLGYSSLAQTRYATDKDSKLTHYLEEITKAGERARDLVTCMLTYSRSQTNEITAAMDPAPLVKEVIKMLSTTIPSSIKLQAQVDDDIPAISMSPAELHQIVMNLVINARDAMVEHGCLDLRLSTLVEASELCVFCKRVKNNALCQGDIYGEYVSLSVTDTGCGISNENIKLIFDPFFTTKGVGKGSGLGLSVIYGIVRRSGGCIVVDSHPGNGSTFQVLLPAASHAAVDLPAAATPLPSISGGNGARILVVDDEPALVHYLADLLEGQNYVVDVYTDSVEALNYFRTNPQGIDAVITDQTMPNKSGIEIADAMLALRPDLPVFLCSGYSDSIDESTQLFGIRRFFNKPVSATELLIALNEEITQPVI